MAQLTITATRVVYTDSHRRSVRNLHLDRRLAVAMVNAWAVNWMKTSVSRISQSSY